MKTKHALAGFLIFGLASLFLLSASAAAGGESCGSDWRYLPFGSRAAVTGVHFHPDMDWTKTKHIFTLADGKTKRNKWYAKKLGVRIFEFPLQDGSRKVRYDVDNNKGTNITSITIKLRDSNGMKLCEETYLVP